MSDELKEGAGKIIARSPKSAKTAEAKKTPMSKKADLAEGASKAPAATPAVKKTAKASKVTDELEPLEEVKAVKPTPKAVKGKAEAAPEAPVPKGTAKTNKTGFTTAAADKGGLNAEATPPNHSYKLDIANVPKLLSCTNSYRVFCNIPPGLLTEEQENEWKAGLKAARISTLTCDKKKLETLHEQMGNRAKQDLLIFGWVADPDYVHQIFGEENFTYVFIYPKSLRGFYMRLTESKGADEARKFANEIKEAYYKHLDKYDHAVITALV